MKSIVPVVVLVLLLAFVLGTGCVETRKQTVQAGTVLAGYEMTEHTYLWGPGGPFTKTYDIRIWLFGRDVYTASGVSKYLIQSSIRQYLNSTAGTETPG